MLPPFRLITFARLAYCNGELETVGVVPSVVKRITPVWSAKNKRCPDWPCSAGVASKVYVGLPVQEPTVTAVPAGEHVK